MFTISMSTMSNVLCTVYHVLWRGCVSLESEKGEKGEGKNVCRRDNGRTEIRGSLRGPREPKNEVKQDQGQKALPIKGDDEGCCHQRGKHGQHAGKLLEAPPSLGAGYTQDVFEGHWGGFCYCLFIIFAANESSQGFDLGHVYIKMCQHWALGGLPL